MVGIFMSIKPMKERPEPPRDTRSCKALVASSNGVSTILAHQSHSISWMISEIGEEEVLLDFGITSSDGIWVWEGKFNVYNCQWTGEQDTSFEGEYRKPTKEEWERHVDGEEFGDPEPEDMVAYRLAETKRNAELSSACCELECLIEDMPDKVREAAIKRVKSLMAKLRSEERLMDSKEN